CATPEAVPMIIDASCHISLHANAPIPLILMLRPRSGLAQWIMREEYSITPPSQVVEYTDSYGNLCQRVIVGPGDLTITCSCRADTADAIDVQESAEFEYSSRMIHCASPLRGRSIRIRGIG